MLIKRHGTPGCLGDVFIRRNGWTRGYMAPTEDTVSKTPRNSIVTRECSLVGGAEMIIISQLRGDPLIHFIRQQFLGEARSGEESPAGEIPVYEKE